jgi:hypothetical protein
MPAEVICGGGSLTWPTPRETQVIAFRRDRSWVRLESGATLGSILATDHLTVAAVMSGDPGKKIGRHGVAPPSDVLVRANQRQGGLVEL